MVALPNLALLLLVLSIPLSGLGIEIGLGELQGEGSFFTSLAYIAALVVYALAGGYRGFSTAAVFIRSQSVYALLIIASFVLAYPVITGNDVGFRTGVNRYFSSILTFLYYLCLGVALCVHAQASGFERFIGRLQYAFFAMGLFLLVVELIEVASWFSGGVQSALVQVRSALYANPSLAPFRLSGASLEPSYNALALLAAMPWLICRGYIPFAGLRKFLGLALLTLCLLSGSRTAYVGLAAMLAFGGLQMVVRRMPNAGRPLMSYAALDSESSVSDVTRSYLAAKAIEAGWDRPMGQGYGQASFYTLQQASSMSELSWELKAYYGGSRSLELPPVFSWYARSFAEFGPLGYILLIGSFALFFSSALSMMLRRNAISASPAMIIALFASQLFAAGLSIDSIRTPQYWLSFVILSAAMAYSRLTRASASARLGRIAPHVG
jgi:hypothetical protein